MTQWLSQLINCVYPPVCAICRRPCQPVSGYPGICRLCLARMPLLSLASEGYPWPDQAGHDGPSGDRIYACMSYEEPIRSALIRLKFFGETDIAELVASLLALLVRRTRIHCSAVLAVPLHTSRLRQRGFNQSGLIAAALARRLALPDLSGTLIRTRPTPQQSLLEDRRLRQGNVHGAFAFYPEFQQAAAATIRPGSTVWLLDDIMTTGATLQESARPLWQAGLHVQGLVAALAQSAKMAGSDR